MTRSKIIFVATVNEWRIISARPFFFLEGHASEIATQCLSLTNPLRRTKKMIMPTPADIMLPEIGRARDD